MKRRGKRMGKESKRKRKRKGRDDSGTHLVGELGGICLWIQELDAGQLDSAVSTGP